MAEAVEEPSRPVSRGTRRGETEARVDWVNYRHRDTGISHRQDEQRLRSGDVLDSELGIYGMANQNEWQLVA